MKIVKAVIRRDAERDVEAWIAALLAAEAAAAAEPGAQLRYFMINYRVSDDPSDRKGTSRTRRESLVEIIQSLEPVEKHLSTSTWVVKLHIEKASDLTRLLLGPLDGKLDGLHVSHVSRRNRATFGVTKLES